MSRRGKIIIGAIVTTIGLAGSVTSIEASRSAPGDVYAIFHRGGLASCFLVLTGVLLLLTRPEKR